MEGERERRREGRREGGRDGGREREGKKEGGTLDRSSLLHYYGNYRCTYVHEYKNGP